jgi:hypothetical protein
MKDTNNEAEARRQRFRNAVESISRAARVNVTVEELDTLPAEEREEFEKLTAFYEEKVASVLSSLRAHADAMAAEGKSE